MRKFRLYETGWEIFSNIARKLRLQKSKCKQKDKNSDNVLLFWHELPRIIHKFSEKHLDNWQFLINSTFACPDFLILSVTSWQKSYKSVQILQNIFISQNYSKYIYMICLIWKDLIDFSRSDSWQITSHSAHWYIVPYGQKYICQ